MCGEHAGFPDLSFLTLTVSAEYVDGVVVLRGLLAERHSNRHGKTLAEGTGSLEDTGKSFPDGRVTLQAGPELTEGGQLAGREVPGAGKD